MTNSLQTTLSVVIYALVFNSAAALASGGNATTALSADNIKNSWLAHFITQFCVNTHLTFSTA